MKFIHCADLHLDSRLSANFDKERAKGRKGEILDTFVKMLDYADENDVKAILIAGDMFDTKNISATVRNTVLHCITKYEHITFYYLRGNHDQDNFLSELEEIPHNFKMFDTTWTTYEEADGKICISGVELTNENSGSIYAALTLDANAFHIVMLHGQDVDGVSKDKAQIIYLRDLKNRGIDYLALGHIHAYKREKLDARGIYCYSGCLEGRGFDECGEHGFVLLDIEEETGKFTDVFIPFAKRQLYTIDVDVTDCETTAQMIEKANTEIQGTGCPETSLLKIVLKGTLDVECEKDLVYFLAHFQQSFYFVKVYDETMLKVDWNDYLLDESLKGEYVRQVMEDDALSEEEKMIVVRYGLQAIAGEEVQ